MPEYELPDDDPRKDAALRMNTLVKGFDTDVRLTNYNKYSDATGRDRGIDLVFGNDQEKSGYPIPNFFGKEVTVSSVSYDAGLGHFILLDVDGQRVQLSHLEDAPPYKKGDTIRPNQALGSQGDSGRSRGVHVDLRIGTPETTIEERDAILYQIVGK